MTKNRNNVKAVNNTSAPSLGEEETKTIEDLKRRMVLMEEGNLKLFNGRKKKIYVMEDSQKLQKGKIWRLCCK